MKLDLQDVEHIAELARLNLSKEEMAIYQEQLSAILDHFERLQELETEDIPPTATALPIRSVMREDQVRKPTDRDAILHNAPADEDGCFEVPAVLD